MKRATAIAAAALALAVGAVVAQPANDSAEAWGGSDKFLLWVATPVVTVRPDGQSCSITTGQLRMQEFGKHGVTAFKYKFELRGTYDPGWLPTYSSAGYFWTNHFVNNYYNRYHDFALRDGYIALYRTTGDSPYHLWVKAVGVRYGMPDYTRHVDLGTVICSRQSTDDGSGGGGYGGFEGGTGPVIVQGGDGPTT